MHPKIDALSYHINPFVKQLQTTVFPKDHDVVLASLGNLAFAKAKNAEFKKALQVSVAYAKWRCVGIVGRV
jgi:multidrug transporter EmrE-like cation transporter